jgi:hypothetical protein
MTAALAARTEYKVIVAPTRDGWRYVLQMRRGAHKAWTDFPPYRQFASRAEAEQYLETLE